MNRSLCIIFLCNALAVTLGAQEKEDPLQDLQGKWLGARQRVLKPVDEAYIKQLEALKIAATKKGDLDFAIRVQEELDRVNEELSVASEKTLTGDQVRQGLTDTMWTGMAGSLQGWKVQLQSGGNISLVRPDNTEGWGGWRWNVDSDGVLTINIPTFPKPYDAKLSRRLDRIAITWGNGTTLKRDTK